MRLVGLNGLNPWIVNRIIPGRIDNYFDKGIFPSKWNWHNKFPYWRNKHIAFIERDILEPTLLVGFSDGATMAQYVAALSSKRDLIKGVVAHSCELPDIDFNSINVPILLMRTIGDGTPTFKETLEAYHLYKMYDKDVTIVDLEPEPNTYFKHQFGNGIQTIKDWYRDKFGAWSDLK